MASEKHQQKAREALSVRTLTPTQMEDCIPSVAAALEATERDTAQKRAEIAMERCRLLNGDAMAMRRRGREGMATATEMKANQFVWIAAMIRAEFGITEKETTR